MLFNITDIYDLIFDFPCSGMLEQWWNCYVPAVCLAHPGLSSYPQRLCLHKYQQGLARSAPHGSIPLSNGTNHNNSRTQRYMRQGRLLSVCRRACAPGPLILAPIAKRRLERAADFYERHSNSHGRTGEGAADGQWNLVLYNMLYNMLYYYVYNICIYSMLYNTLYSKSIQQDNITCYIAWYITCWKYAI